MRIAKKGSAGQSPALPFSVSKSLQSKLFLPQKRPDFRVIARPQRGRGNLKVEGMASRTEAREHVAKRNPYRKKHRFAALFRVSSLHSKVLLRPVQPYFVSE